MIRALAVAALVVLLAGCTSVRSTVTDSLDQAVSATSTAALAVKLASAGHLLTPPAETALSDALTELDDAATALVDAGAATAGESAARRDALAAIRSATDAVLAARDDLSAGRDLAGDEAARNTARDALQELAAASGDPS
ncbi:MAG: hypothetical protein ACTHKX_06460 [Pseudolysinimonas sp.]